MASGSSPRRTLGSSDINRSSCCSASPWSLTHCGETVVSGLSTATSFAATPPTPFGVGRSLLSFATCMVYASLLWEDFDDPATISTRRAQHMMGLDLKTPQRSRKHSVAPKADGLQAVNILQSCKFNVLGWTKPVLT